MSDLGKYIFIFINIQTKKTNLLIRVMNSEENCRLNEIKLWLFISFKAISWPYLMNSGEVCLLECDQTPMTLFRLKIKQCSH